MQNTKGRGTNLLNCYLVVLSEISQALLLFVELASKLIYVILKLSNPGILNYKPVMQVR